MEHPERLTQTVAERAKPDPEGEYRIQDEQVPGLSLRVRPGGSKAFILRYRTTEGRQRLLTLGRFPDISVKKARKRALDKRGDVSGGADPVEDRKRARGGTFKQTAERWVEEYAKPHRKSWKEDRRRLDKHLLPALGTRPLVAVNEDDLRDLSVRMGKRTPVEANRVLNLARTIFHWATRVGLLPPNYPNPASGVKRFREKSRERWLTAKEVERLGKALAKVRDPYQKAAIQLLLLTGCRVTELLRARWDRLDLDARRLLLEDTKTGEAKTVALSPPALAILRDLPRALRSPWIFPSPKDHQKPVTTIRGTWAKVRKAARVPDATVHDLRRTAGSWLVQKGVPLQTVGAALGHKDHRSTLVYARIANEAPAEALELLGEAFGSVLAPSG